ncbi:hypothetical protein LR48_Vigan11g103800 [Vigna angularis]|uniref:Uncharacterized protein n=1 Tax=Phaseolus angularis TaxID=3914 RepID=A0A0L9VSH4_PHAAN|nr:hypothetical protein LR48_Vigan11g103800 [Vigna angularis]
MQPELELHVSENERLDTSELTCSDLETDRFKLKLRTPVMLPRCLNDDRRREMVRFLREKVDGGWWRMKKPHDDVVQRREELAIRFRDACGGAFGTTT